MYRECFLCGRNGNGDPLERHHIFGGPNRKLSEKYGLVVYLCGDRCHRNGPFSAHKNADTALALHKYGERMWIREQHGTIEDFIKVFGRNYLDEEEIVCRTSTVCETEDMPPEISQEA